MISRKHLRKSEEKTSPGPWLGCEAMSEMPDGYSVPQKMDSVLALGALGLCWLNRTVKIPGLTIAFSGRAKMALTFGNLSFPLVCVESKHYFPKKEEKLPECLLK